MISQTRKIFQLAVVTHTFNPSTGEAEAGEFEASLSWSYHCKKYNYHVVTQLY